MWSQSHVLITSGTIFWAMRPNSRDAQVLPDGEILATMAWYAQRRCCHRPEKAPIDQDALNIPVFAALTRPSSGQRADAYCASGGSIQTRIGVLLRAI